MHIYELHRGKRQLYLRKKKESEIGTNDEFTCFRIFRSQ